MNLIPRVVRTSFTRLLGPLAQVLVRLHIRPNAITTVGTLIVVCSAVAYGFGHVRWGGFLLLLSGVFDMLDGRVARDGGMKTTFGAFYDSTLDRLGESAVFTGIAVYFLQGGIAPERLTLAVVACCVALAGSLTVSYARARAEGLGLEGNVGIAQRAERILLLGGATMFFGAARQGMLLLGIVMILALVSVVTVVQRVVHVARAADGRDVSPERPARSRDTLPERAAALHSPKGN
ncbi:MAG TPA: CDP-alcohol phosphatidyltransferase family protein [Gemmatimonadales bacterium]|nr:CDP-alcohol phosphatidyltransferase family protein [Gemmatimonadales bacterium]